VRRSFASIRCSGLLLGLASALSACPGCRSATQNDLIAREMRQQEDQIYALQDYLADYERVLCQVRSENAALRRALAERQFREELPSPGGREPTPPSRPPSPPARNGRPVEAELTVPEAPPLELPEVPPPETSSHEADGIHVASPLADETDPPPDVVPAAYEEPVVDDTPSPVTSVAVLGEVVTKNGANGPRVLVEVVPLDAAGESTEFEGELSVMFLAPGADDARALARWDFSAEELPQFVRQSAAGTSFAFPLQLPPKTPTQKPLELWVRLVPSEGDKLLGRTSIDLGRPGRFASDEPQSAEPVAQAASAVVRSPCPSAVQVEPRMYEDNGWSVALPGDVAETNGASLPQADAKWRKATQPVPIVESRPPQPDPLDEPLDAFEEFDRNREEQGGSHRTPAASPWSPQRVDEVPAQVPTAPSWAPTR